MCHVPFSDLGYFCHAFYSVFFNIKGIINLKKDPRDNAILDLHKHICCFLCFSFFFWYLVIPFGSLNFCLKILRLIRDTIFLLFLFWKWIYFFLLLDSFSDCRIKMGSCMSSARGWIILLSFDLRGCCEEAGGQNVTP
jgi:hypothetical protein